MFGRKSNRNTCLPPKSFSPRWSSSEKDQVCHRHEIDPCWGIEGGEEREREKRKREPEGGTVSGAWMNDGHTLPGKTGAESACDSERTGAAIAMT